MAQFLQDTKYNKHNVIKTDKNVLRCNEIALSLHKI